MQIALFSTIFLTVFSLTMANMAAPYIVGSLGGSNEISTYVTSFFAIGNAIGVPLGKPLFMRFGGHKALTACLFLFGLFTLLCPFMSNYPLFVGCRFFQGLVSGPFYVLVTHLFSFLIPEEKRSQLISRLVMIFTAVPVLGGCWGGWISYDYEWPWIFYWNAPLIFILAVYVWIKVPEEKRERNVFDKVGYFFYFLSIFLLSVSLVTGQQLDWHRSPLTVLMWSVGGVSLLFFILWEKYTERPLLDLSLFRSFSLLFSLLNLAVLFSAYFGMILLLGLWLNLDANYTPIWIAILLGTMGVAAFFGPLLIQGKLSSFDPRIPLTLAIFLLSISCFYTTIFDIQIDLKRIAFSRILAGLGLALFLPPIFRLSFQGVPHEKSIDVLTIFQITRALSSGLGCALYTTLWQRRRVFFHERMGEELTALSKKTGVFFEKANQLSIEGEKALAVLEKMLNTRATSLALDDSFYLMGWILTGLLVFVLLSLLRERIGDAKNC